jgi:sulfite reductase (NADPH) hemoprotein beta-component
MPELMDRLDEIVDRAGLRNDAISIRLAGCNNSCSRIYPAEIGLIGVAPERYDLYLGGSFDGTRLSKRYRVGISPDEVVEVLRLHIYRYAKEHVDGEHFGDFCVRVGVVRATTNGFDFHDGAA